MAARLTPEERLWRAMPERAWQDKVLDIARTFGWRAVHFSDSRRQVARQTGKKLLIGDKDAKGWPDTTLAHERGGPLIIAELKAMGERPTPEQQWWLDQCWRPPVVFTDCWWPCDEARVIRILRTRVWVPRPGEPVDY